MANLENKNQNNENTEKSFGENSENLVDKVQENISETTENVKQSVETVAEQAKLAVENPVETVENLAEQAKKDVKNYKWWAKILLILFWTGLFLIGAFFVIINLPSTKDYAAQRALGFLNEDFGVHISKEQVEVNIFGDVIIHGLQIKDDNGNNLIHAERFRADSDWFSMLRDSRDLKFQTLSLYKANVNIVTYKGDSISNFIRFVDRFSSGPPSKNKKPFQLQSRVNIVDSKISIINLNHEGDEGKWLQAENVNLRIPQLKVYGPDVSARINNLTFLTKRWGKAHFVETFSGDFNLNKDALTLSDLTLNTDHSLLQGDLIFGLHDGSWSDFGNKVRWNLNLKLGSQISGYDISYFVTDWDNYRPVNISGKMTGSLNKFFLSDFLLSSNDVKLTTGTMKIQGVLDKTFLIETNNVSTDFTYKSLKAMLPSFISKKMGNFADDFGRLKYNGALRTNPNEIYANGRIVTGVGQAKVSNLILRDYSTANPKYKGFLDVKDLNTTAFTKNKQVGLISGRFNIEGESFDINKMKLRTRSEITSLQLMGKPVRNIFLDGVLANRVYRGIVNVNDTEARAKVNGVIDFSKPRLFADVVADVDYLNLNYFGVKGDRMTFRGNVDGEISFTNINDMNLNANLRNVNLVMGKTNYDIPNGLLKAYFENGNRIISVDAPNVAKGSIKGRYNIEDLGGMIQNGLNRILVGNVPKRLYRGQSFTFDFVISQALVDYFEKNAKIAEGAKVNGSFDGNSNNLILNADIPRVNYLMTKTEQISEADKAMAALNPDYKIPENKTQTNAILENVVIRINTANQNEQIFARIDRAEYDNNIFRDVVLAGRNENNQILHLAANFKHGTPEQDKEDNLKSYAINLNQSVDDRGDIVVRFEPTEFKFNNFVWNVDTSQELNHSITYRKKTGDFLIQNLRLYSDNSELLVKNATFKSAKNFDADIDVRNVDISKLWVSADESMDIKGVANGNMKIRMTENELEPIVDLTVNDIFMNGQDMGNMVINAKKSSVRNVFDIDAKINSAGIIGNNNLSLTGTINNNTPSPTLDLVADLQDFDIKFAQVFLTSIFSNFRGKASGKLNIKGDFNQLKYEGNLAMKNFGLKPKFSGVDYSFDDTNINVDNGRILILEPINIKDGRNNSLGTISIGVVDLSNLKNVSAELFVRAENLLLLNTTQKDFDVFWGRIIGKGDIFVGFTNNILRINADAQILNSSVFTLNSGTASSVDEFKMLRFLKRDDIGNISVAERVKTSPNVEINLNLDIDRGSTVNVLIGDDVGNISVRGYGEDIKFNMSRNGTMTMNGNYFVDNGTFVSKTILERTFQIQKGSSMVFDGDAMNPALDITANYFRVVSNAGDYLNIGVLPPLNVLLQTKISQTLKSPLVEFNVSATDVSSQVREALAFRMSDENEKVRQFASVLVLNNFIVENSALQDFNITGALETMGQNLLMKQLGAVINSISNEFQIDLNYIRGDAGSNSGDRANIGGSFILSPRVTLKTGVGIPISRTENASQNLLSGEGIIEYDWSKRNDGTRIFRAYSKPSNIGTVTAAQTPGANQSYGIGVVYSKSFNTIFKRKSKETEKKPSAISNSEETQAPKENSTPQTQENTTKPKDSISVSKSAEAYNSPAENSKKSTSKKFSLLRVKG